MGDTPHKEWFSNENRFDATVLLFRKVLPNMFWLDMHRLFQGSLHFVRDRLASVRRTARDEQLG